MISSTSPRGFTLLIAVILSSVIASVGLALLEVTLKQVILASAATQSQYAFYNADTALECVLYWDQKRGAFDFAYTSLQDTITCADIPVQNITGPSGGALKTTTFTVPCTSGSGSLGSVSISKTASGQTTIFANGYNSCDANDPRRLERGLKATYGT